MPDNQFLKQIPWLDAAQRSLPGVQPLVMCDWLHCGSDFAFQMKERDRLIDEKQDCVCALDMSGKPAVIELLDRVLQHIADNPEYKIDASWVMRPDGVKIEIDYENPLITLGRLCQEDFCILQKDGSEHILTAAVLCFPASWCLSEKFMRPLTDIHLPVDAYTDDIARRVQRLFNGIKADRPLWRANALWYEDPALFQPRSAADPRHMPDKAAPYLRSERQCLLRLPKTGAVVFSIRTALMIAD